jgi:hypothetical protein
VALEDNVALLLTHWPSRCSGVHYEAVCAECDADPRTKEVKWTDARRETSPGIRETKKGW